MIVIVVLDITLIYAPLSNTNHIYKLTEENLSRIMKKYDFNSKTKHENIFVDKIQNTFKCCGVKSSRDWDTKFNRRNNSYPSSCCPKIVKNCDEMQVWPKGYDDSCLV
ncbi:CD63 antigen-like protein [Leptotrombidium deliense]|uniref:CD63 antigen-like protein n=1 Tax=Leptotrombidium deliense TaxID=299467 RepID=A0A443RY62_9ACAR|nr:CD63 antigen-like protein [Leptotrombidium deliense]